MLPGLVYCLRGTALRVRDVLAGAARPASASGLAALAWLAAQTLLPSIGMMGDLARGGLVFGLVYLLFWRLLPGGRSTAAEVGALLRRLISAEANAGRASRAAHA